MNHIFSVIYMLKTKFTVNNGHIMNEAYTDREVLCFVKQLGLIIPIF